VLQMLQRQLSAERQQYSCQLLHLRAELATARLRSGEGPSSQPSFELHSVGSGSSIATCSGGDLHGEEGGLDAEEELVPVIGVGHVQVANGGQLTDTQLWGPMSSADDDNEEDVDVVVW
jgi:hypothetical protein